MILELIVLIDFQVEKEFNFAFSIKIVRYRDVLSLNFHDNECLCDSFASLVSEIRP